MRGGYVPVGEQPAASKSTLQSSSSLSVGRSRVSGGPVGGGRGRHRGTRRQAARRAIGSWFIVRVMVITPVPPGIVGIGHLRAKKDVHGKPADTCQGQRQRLYHDNSLYCSAFISGYISSVLMAAEGGALNSARRDARALGPELARRAVSGCGLRRGAAFVIFGLEEAAARAACTGAAVLLPRTMPRGRVILVDYARNDIGCSVSWSPPSASCSRARS